MQPLIGLSYQPADADEKGLWQSLERFEEELASSNLVFDAPDMHSYFVRVMRKLLGDRAKDTRVYLVHDASFNALMAPNGMMIVQSGLLARVRNEAQLAAVLGHDSGHYLRRHSIAQFRDRERKTAVMAFVSAGAGVLAGVSYGYGADGRSWIDLANSINGGILSSIFRFSRDQESEADAFGLRLLDEAGYSPDAAASMWAQLIEERRASAAARSKRYRDNARSEFSTHPPSEARMLDLTPSAREVSAVFVQGRQYSDGRAEWLSAVAPIRGALLEEQIKQNDPGASLYLVNALASDGWDGTLRLFAGEVFRLRDAPGDAANAARAYAATIEMPEAPPEAWRAHGYGLVKTGRADEGHRALARYLELKPNSSDAAMIRFTLAQ